MPFISFISLPPRSLRVRLALSFTLFIAVLLLAADAGLIGYAHYVESRRTDSELEQALQTVHTALIDETNEAQAVGRSQTTVGANRTAAASGISAASETMREIGPILAQDGVWAAIIDDQGHFWQTEATRGVPQGFHLTDEKGWRRRSLCLAPGPAGASQPLTIIVGVPWKQVEAKLHRQAALLLVLTLFTVLVAAVGVYFLVGRALQPIDLLAQQALEQARQRFTGSVQLAAPSPDVEVTRLVTTLNHLLQTLAENAEMKSRFYTAASHELRTPLQILSGRVELTLSRPRSQEEYQAALAEVQEQADHLIALAQSLLLLNRLERAAPSDHVVAVDLAAACREQFRAARVRERADDVPLIFEAASGRLPLVKAVSPAHVEVLVRNLLENAVRYTPEGGSIRLKLGSDQKASVPSVQMEVVNTSSPMLPADEARLLEPFYRPDPSRNAQSGGTGLGLTICRALSDLNGWTLSLRQSDDTFQVQVVFPAQSPEVLS